MLLMLSENQEERKRVAERSRKL